jgi:quercetin dioxygenase-like cupin family protein
MEGRMRYQRGGPPPESGQADFEGADYGSEVSFFVVHMPAGEGPPMHTHPYSETFVVQAGRAHFEVGDRSVEAAAGDVVVAPPGTPHAFKAVGPAALGMVNIHAAPRMETSWLEARPEGAAPPSPSASKRPR